MTTSDGSTETPTGTCGRCGTTYKRYKVLFMKDPRVMDEWSDMKNRYGNVCESCWHELSESGKYAITEYNTTPVSKSDV